MTRRKHSRPARDIAPVHPHAAAVDIGATLHVAAVRPGCDPEPVRTFGTFTTDLHRLADWFEQCGVETVAMESTGVYWIPLLRDPRSAWLRGGGERPRRQARPGPQDRCQRRRVAAAPARIRAVTGQLPAQGRDRDPAELSAPARAAARRGGRPHPAHAEGADRDEPAAPPRRRGRDGRDGPAHPPGSRGRRARSGHLGGLQRPAPAETLRAALVGNYREEHVFALAQALELYDVYQAKVAACDQRIEAVLERLKAANPPPAAALPPARPRRRQANEPGFAVREALHAILGADPTQIDGIGPSLALTLVGECGTDLSAWPSAKHFTSWLSLAPHNKISGGKVLSARTRRSGSRAAALLRLAAVAVGRTATALGAFYRRLAARVGKAKAVTATARKIGVLFYNMLRHGMDYADPGASAYEARYRQRVLSNLRRRAKSLGYVLQRADPASAAIAVS